MKLISFEINDMRCLGADHKGRVVDLNAAYKALHSNGDDVAGITDLPSDMLTFLWLGEPAMKAAHRAIEFAMTSGVRSSITGLTRNWDEVRLLAPVPRPGKILCAGVNFKSHLNENPNAQLPESPRIFAKLPSVVIGPGDSIVHPVLTKQLDYEVELAVIIGRKMRFVSKSAALSYVAGYTILNDVSARDVQSKGNQITLGKNFESFSPMGPCLTTPDEIADPRNVRLRTFINGDLRQDGSTADWIFPLDELLSFLSDFMVLEPGDVVSTGTPAGVGLFRKPPVFLQPGDFLRLEIDGIGYLENQVVASQRN